MIPPSAFAPAGKSRTSDDRLLRMRVTGRGAGALPRGGAQNRPGAAHPFCIVDNPRRPTDSRSRQSPMEPEMSDGFSDYPSRLEALEAQFTHQERTIAELNDVVVSQWRKIDSLERLVVQMREEIRNIGTARDAPEPPPPHY
jgi:uncharacterized coiled-coil protein SlyX